MSTLKNDNIVNLSDLYVQTSPTAGTVPYTTQIPDLGVRSVTGDGREFRFVQAGASNLIVGQLLQAPAPQSNLQGVTGVATAQGSTTVTLTISTGSAITAGQLSGGYLISYGTVANGGGQCLQISTNSAVSVSGTSITLTLADPLQIALTTSATVSIYPMPYRGVVQMPTSQVNKAVGVALGTYPNPSTSLNGLVATYYGWVQVKGTSMALIEGTPAIAVGLAASTSTAGALTGVSGTTSAPNANIATNLLLGVNGQYGPVDLLIS